MIKTFLLILLLSGQYDRSLWKHWIDEDKDCLDTRQEVLLEESLEPPTLSGKCKIEGGVWHCLYSDTWVNNPKLLDIDHIVPLSHAYKMGGDKWDFEKRKAYANDLSFPGHLIAVSKYENRSKGNKAPNEWMPLNEEYWCEYLENWITVKNNWDLEYSKDEYKFIFAKLIECNCIN